MTTLAVANYRAVGFHGCPRSRAEQIQADGVQAWPSSTGWLGSGIYFWDNDESTGRWWARRHYRDREPTVVRAEIDLSNSLDLSNVFGQNALAKLRRLGENNPETQKRLERLDQDGFSKDGALLYLAREKFEADTDAEFSSLRAPVHMTPSEETMETVEDTDLITGFRLVIVVYEPSVIGEIEVNHVD